MKNHYFFWEHMCGWEFLPIYDDCCSDDLKSLRAGKDFFPGQPLVVEMYHVSSYDYRSRKYAKGPAAIAVFNTPKLSKNGKITSTAKWSYKNMDEFWAFLKNSGYYKFTSEHWSKGDFGTLYVNTPGSIQAVRMRFYNQSHSRAYLSSVCPGPH